MKALYLYPAQCFYYRLADEGYHYGDSYIKQHCPEIPAQKQSDSRCSGYDEIFCQFVDIRVYVVTKIKKFRQNSSLSELFQPVRIYSAVVSVASGLG